MPTEMDLLAHAEVFQHLGVSEQTYYRWKTQQCGMKSKEAKCLKELEVENARLKKQLSGKTVEHLEGSFEVSERRAGVVLDQPRSTQRYRWRPASDEASLVMRMHEMVREHPRFGKQRIVVLLQREGFQAGFDRVYRLWRLKGLKVPKTPRKDHTLSLQP